MIRNIIIKGERCSGTNYIQHLIMANTDFRKSGHHLSLDPGADMGAVWKHGVYDSTHIPFNTEETLFLLIHRNMHDWLRSIYASPWHLPQRDSFMAFISGSLCCGDCPHYYHYIPEYIDGEEYCGDIISLRYIKARSWMDHIQRYQWTDYDALAAQPERIIGILRGYGIAMREGFVHWGRYKDTAYEYQPKEYFALSDEERAYIDSRTDHAFEQMLRQ